MPLVRGSFIPSGNGTSAEIVFSLQPIVLVLIITFLIIIPIWSEYSKNGNALHALITCFSFFLVLHTVLYFIGFLPEIRRAESLLRDLLGDYQ